MDIYQVFHDPPLAQGNFVAVTFAATPQAGVDRPPASMLAHCQITHHRNNHFTVVCQQSGRTIQCCGHGLLAAADAIFDASDHKVLYLGDGISAARTQEDQGKLQTLLYLPPVAATGIHLPSWAQGMLTASTGEPVTPLGAAATDNLDGYLLLQLAGGIHIGELAVNLDAICSNTRRAVLLWQLDQQADHVVRVRYFAPQYGNDEDAATGSALRVLIPHLLHLTGLTFFSVIQSSPSGGRMTAKMIGDSVAISGNVRLVDSKELPAQWQPQK